MASDAQTLMNVARQHAAMTGSSLYKLLQLALLIQIANQVAPAMATDPQSLLNYANVNGYVAVSNGSLADALELALLEIIANNIGGGGGGGANILIKNYGGGTPTDTPTGNAFAVDTSTNALWSWNGSVWTQLIA